MDAGTNRSLGGLDRIGKRARAAANTLYWYFTQGRPTRKRWLNAKSAGQKIVQDNLGLPVREREPQERAADFSPGDGQRRKAKFMKLKAYPEPDYAFGTAGDVSNTRLAVDDPRAMADDIKSRVQAMGAEAVGVTALTRDMKFDNRPLPDLAQVVVFSARMDREAALWASSAGTSTLTNAFDTLLRTTGAAFVLAFVRGVKRGVATP